VTERPALYITRKFPPSVGGMETLAENVWRAVRTIDPDAVLIAHGGSVPSTAWWLPGALIRMCALAVRRGLAVVLCGDVALYAVVGPLLRVLRVPHAVMAMGLDVTFPHSVYRRLALPGLRRAPMVLAISEATAQTVRAAGVDPDRIHVVGLGISDPEVDDAARSAARQGVRTSLGIGPDEHVLATVGRMVPRKGVAWFTEHVLTSLPPDVHYAIAGDGPERPLVEGLVERLGLGSRVHLLGRVDDAQRDQLMRGADVFVQPNIAVPGDMEGFGLVAIEAAMNGSLVVAADLEGLQDAVSDGETGDLLPSGDAGAWTAHLTALLHDSGTPARAECYRVACVRRSSFAVMVEQLRELLTSIAPGVRQARR
jgi:phosphatidyl-myo-inositol dimannoside synthase